MPPLGVMGLPVILRRNKAIPIGETAKIGIVAVKLIAKKGSTFHDFPYAHPERKCFHCWIINVTPPGPSQCVHSCIYCYA
ncbi:hypothetical protein ACFLW7_05290, partial [Chloroflexota bacterium]